MKGKSLIGVILAAICVTVTYLLPGSEELSHEGITALGVLGMASILWISNTLPFGVTGLLALVMLVLLGVSDMASVFVGFSNSSVIFVITVFCLTAAVMNTKLTLRLINKLLRWAGSSAEKLVLAYMAAAALLSSVMSNVPVKVSAAVRCVRSTLAPESTERKQIVKEGDSPENIEELAAIIRREL